VAQNLTPGLSRKPAFYRPQANEFSYSGKTRPVEIRIGFIEKAGMIGS
jgi:hypothetical protein